MRITFPATIPEETDPTSGRDTVIVEWTVHLLANQPRKLWGVIAGALVAAALGWTVFQSWVGAILGGGLVLSAVAEFLLPIRYRLTSQQATCSYGLARLSLPWSSVRRIIEAPGSVRLSPFGRPSRLDALRGVELRFGPDGSSGSREIIMALIQRLASCSTSRTDGPGAPPCDGDNDAR